ncbi:MAG: hypothetical protein CME70_10230 [Halobacteriovorax sp.]|nr:hypothetical protein [Halobacteriovorax sp.]|tara:strand:- start:27819 stop:29429 length:1611 start_codon:yes stop_codon:yes gene_type:complete
MKFFISLTILTIVLSGCGQKRSGKRKGRINQFQQEQEILETKGLRLADLKAKKIEVHSEGTGLVEVGILKNTEKRFLRDKILQGAYLNLAGYSAKDDLRISDRDEFRFYPGEVLLESKFFLNKAFEKSPEERVSWRLEGEIAWEGLKEGESLQNITISLGAKSKNKRNLSYFGNDLLSSRRAEVARFDRKRSRSTFSLSFVDLPKSVVKNLADFNNDMFLEIKDFKLDQNSMKQFLSKRKNGKTRLIVSTPTEEKFYLIPNGKRLKDYLKGLDQNLSFDHLGRIDSFMNLNISELFNFPDRNILENISLYGRKNIWWSNVDEDIENYKADGSTIVLAYTDLISLRSTRYSWSPFKKELKEKNHFLKVNSRKIVGEITKRVKTYSSEEWVKEIPFEIAREVCLEDHRFERKGVNCHNVWEAAFSYPSGAFRKAVESNYLKEKIKEGEIFVQSKENTLSKRGFLELNLQERDEVLLIKNIEKLESVSGGFIGWKVYDQRLNSYKTRAPYDDLSSFRIKVGHKSNYLLEGWKLGFNLLD